MASNADRAKAMSEALRLTPADKAAAGRAYDVLTNYKFPKGTPESALESLLKDSTEKDKGDFEVLSTPGAVLSVTSSTNPAKPRTLKAGYDYSTNTLTVVFRDGTWWDYRGVPVDTWYSFRAAESKGQFLRESGLDNWGDMGPSDVDSMPRHRRVQMNEDLQYSKAMFKNKE